MKFGVTKILFCELKSILESCVSFGVKKSLGIFKPLSAKLEGGRWWVSAIWSNTNCF